MDRSPPNMGARPGVPPSCAYCGAVLGESAWFKFEMELAAYHDQSPLMQPDVGNHNPTSRIPLTYCEECRTSVSDNANALREQEERERGRGRRIVVWWFAIVLAIALLMLLSS